MLVSCGYRKEAILTNPEKEIIKSEIAPAIDEIIKNSESGNFEGAIV